jgi:hypothetical protein
MDPQGRVQPFDLVAAESLRCGPCPGPLATGPLDEVWADDEEDEG